MRREGIYTVMAQNLYIRSTPTGMAIGTLYPGNTFDAHYVESNGRAWGEAKTGSFTGHGWVRLYIGTPHHSNMHHLFRPHREYFDPYPREIHRKRFAHRINLYPSNDGAPARIDLSLSPGKTHTPLYGNYFSHDAHDKIGLPRDEYTDVFLNDQYPIRWRYITKDRRYVMLRTDRKKHDSSHASHYQTWGFVLRSDVGGIGPNE